MALRTPHSLSDSSVKKLQELIRANIDAYDGFQDAAEATDDERIAALFRELADERSSMASELQDRVEWNGEEAAKEGSLTAGVDRAWMKVRGQLQGGDAYAILTEAERGEDRIQHAYEDVLPETAGSNMHELLRSQFAMVKAGRDRIRQLRGDYRPG